MISKVSRNVASPAAAGVILSCLTACGGTDGPELGPEQGQSAGYAYVATSASASDRLPGTVFQYSIGSDGSLTPLTAMSVASGVNPVAMVSDPTGRYVYVANLGDATISQYSVGVGGILTALSPATVSVGGTEIIGGTLPSAVNYSVSVNPNGRFLYVVVSPHDPAVTSIAQYSIGNDGTLSPLNPEVVSVNAVAPGPVAFDPSGQHAYLAGTPLSLDGEVFQFSVNDYGELIPMVPATVTATPNVSRVAVSQSGKAAYVLSTCIDNACDGQVAEFAIGENGTLMASGVTTLTAGHVIPMALVTDTSASSAYLLADLMGVDTSTEAIYQYAIDDAGALVPGASLPFNVTVRPVSELVAGQNLYALSSNDSIAPFGATGGHIDHYSIGAKGVLAAVSTTPVPEGYPTAMTVVRAH